ncbi:hypothetical protein BKH46_07915 [Helicobacter sp. 12S02634-8]|uniref:hypothetical protein n=1 Tax=Helicobacter sp. 12S02634-8 TaxID=1476199 RepID=UPI000BA6311F|nr:hypothetical protein [Helicobacter sp. 12S02634-8]PAF46385.1 hypothetical protein BKH46_07915 [Helicobacter sp. 12S02634-8]
MRGGYVLLYALGILLGVVYIQMNTLHHSQIALDRTTNAHTRFQSLLDAHSIAEMARVCLEHYDAQDCDRDSFVFEGTLGGYHLIKGSDGRYWADVYVERQNLRTSQILRTHLKTELKIQLKAQPTPQQAPIANHNQS